MILRQLIGCVPRGHEFAAAVMASRRHDGLLDQSSPSLYSRCRRRGQVIFRQFAISRFLLITLLESERLVIMVLNRPNTPYGTKWKNAL